MDRPENQLVRQITFGATVRSEANEKLEVKVKAMTKVPLKLYNAQ